MLWLAESPDLLSGPARAAISQARNQDGLAISDKSLWELAMLISRGRVHVRTSISDFLREIERNFTVLPISGAIAEKSMQFTDRYPKDPTDRIIGATAVVHQIALITKDEQIRNSGEVHCVW